MLFFHIKCDISRQKGFIITGFVISRRLLSPIDMLNKFTYVLCLLWKEENETPGWTQLKLPGQSPSPRCGHTVTSGGHYVITHLKLSYLCRFSAL